jgi:Outer membrane efflux protein
VQVYNEVKKIVVGLVLIAACIHSFAQTKNLQYYLTTGVKNNALLREQQLVIGANALDSQRFEAGLKTQVTGVAANTLSPLMFGFGFDPALTNIAAMNETVNFNRTFIKKNYMQSQRRNFTLFADSVKNEKALSKRDLERTITSQYITVYSDVQQFNFLNDIYEIFKTEEIIIRKLTENNIYRQTDYLTFVVTMQQQQLQIKQAKMQILNDLGTLNYLCGINDTNYNCTNMEAPEIDLSPTPFDISNSLFFRNFTLDSIALSNNIALINFSYQPRFNVYGNAGWVSSLAYQAWKNFGYNFGVGIAVPIYDGHQKKMLLQKNRLQYDILASNREFFTRRYSAECLRLRKQLDATDALLTEINDQITYTEALIKANRKLMQTGDAKIADFIIAVNSYLTAKNLLTQNRNNRLQIINQINYWNQ